MESRGFVGFDPDKIPSPAFVVDLSLLEENGRILKQVADESGARVLLALKGFSMFSVFDTLKPYLNGCCASSPHEARLAREEFGGEVHSYAAAFNIQQLEEFLELSHHLIFNSFSLYRRFRDRAAANRNRLSFGVRINPRQPEADVELYDPSAPYSRLGVPKDQFDWELMKELDGIHIHNLCEQNSDALIRTWRKVEKDFGSILGDLKWINLGGGHHITREDYNRKELINLIREIRKKYNVRVYLEPGEAVALNTGLYISRVLDLTENGKPLAIIDGSVPCHLPDVLEMPYRPHVMGAAREGEKAYSYRIGGQSCLAGDVLGDYSFDRPLEIGQPLLLTDMAHYTMVKTNTFNGIQLPAICTYDSRNGETRVIREFGYGDFKGRLS